jgi:hypothetical protein
MCLTAPEASARVAVRSGFKASRWTAAGPVVRPFAWWFTIGALLTLSVLMVQGGVRDLFDGTHPQSGYLSVGTTILGGGLLAGCVALVMNRIR